MAKPIIESLRDYFMNCPILVELARLNVDYLGVEPTNYTIDGVPIDTTVKKYTDGAKVKQYAFVFASREFYGSDVIQNIENSGFYEKLTEWLEEQTKSKKLPELSGNKEALKIETTTSGYLFQTSEDSARYQLQGRLLYYEEEY